MTLFLNPLNDTKHKPLFLCGLFTFAFLLRIVFALQWQDMPYGAAPQIDAKAYDDWAVSLAAGQGTKGVFYQSPLYPYLLSLLYRISGHSYFAVSLLNGLLDSLTVVLLASVADTLFGFLAAMLTGLLAATYAPMIFYTAPPMKESLVLFLLAAFVFISLRVLRDNRRADYMLCGVCFGLAALARGNVMLLLPVLPLLAWRQWHRASFKGIAIFALAFIAALAPATIHNYLAGHDFVPITYADGFNLYIGHSPYANGTNAYPPELSTSPEQERLQTMWEAEQAAGHSLRPSEVSAYWRGKAVDYAFTHPRREAELFGLKLFAFWNAADSVDNYDPAFIRKNFPSLLNLPLTNFALISALAAFAVFGGVARRRDANNGCIFLIACAAVYMFSVMIFYVTDRYRLPIIIFLMPLAGAALPCALHRVSLPRQKTTALSCAAALFFLFVARHTPLNPVDFEAFDWGTLTRIYDDKGDTEKTFAAFHKGVALSAQGIGMQAYISAAEMDEKRGQPQTAENLITQATQIFPQSGVLLYNLGRLQAARGDLPAALTTMQKAHASDPTYMLIYFALAKIYDKQGDRARGLESLRQGLAIDPYDPRLLELAQQWHVG